MTRTPVIDCHVTPQVMDEEPFPLHRSSEILPNMPSESTVRSMIRHGRLSSNGTTVRLEFCLLHNRTMATSVAAYDRFWKRLNGVE